jgi:ABC-2 type transport system permease protein
MIIGIPRGVLVSEWIKLRSVRSTYLTMLIALALGIIVGMLDCSSTVHNWAAMNATDRAGFDAAGTSLDGFQFGVLAFGVLGVLTISAEYGTGMIRSTFTAVPRRGTVYAAKAIVVGAITLVLGELFVFASFFLGQAMLAGKHLDVSLGDPGVVRALTSAGLSLFVVTMVGFGLGTLIRHSAGAIATLFGLLFLAYPVGKALESRSYLPDRLVLLNAGQVLTSARPPALHAPRYPSVGLAFLDLAVYLVVFVGLGAWRVRQDA